MKNNLQNNNTKQKIKGNSNIISDEVKTPSKKENKKYHKKQVENFSIL